MKKTNTLIVVLIIILGTYIYYRHLIDRRNEKLMIEQITPKPFNF